jgi:hypothetical protein
VTQLTLYRELNGSYSTSESISDDVSGVYVQKTDYEELRIEAYDLRAKLQDLQKLNRETAQRIESIKKEAVHKCLKEIQANVSDIRLKVDKDKDPQFKSYLEFMEKMIKEYIILYNL